MDDLIDGIDAVAFEPSRRAGLARLAAFKASTGRHYATMRNHDFGPADRSNVSALSPWVRNRMVLEQEVVQTALDRFAFSTAEKFIQEVCWRTYFKGWLEHRPGVWANYLDNRDQFFDRLATQPALRSVYDDAVTGQTGIEGFDDWARELVQTGYLHNHARMWFASIWIFTLKLPWELGADFFLKHLMDADAASNTCSWRWVAGLHTAGKTYLARRFNIEKYSGGRFSPNGLAPAAQPVDGAVPPPGPLGATSVGFGDSLPAGDVALLLTEEDLHGESLVPDGAMVRSLAGVSYAHHRSPGGAGTQAAGFVSGAMDDGMARGKAHFGVETAPVLAHDRVLDWALGTGCQTVVTAYPPQGWVRPALETLRKDFESEGLKLVFLKRDWDTAFWPHARKGFFGLKKQIKPVLGELGMPV